MLHRHRLILLRSDAANEPSIARPVAQCDPCRRECVCESLHLCRTEFAVCSECRIRSQAQSFISCFLVSPRRRTRPQPAESRSLGSYTPRDCQHCIGTSSGERPARWRRSVSQGSACICFVHTQRKTGCLLFQAQSGNLLKSKLLIRNYALLHDTLHNITLFFKSLAPTSLRNKQSCNPPSLKFLWEDDRRPRGNLQSLGCE